MVEKEWREWYGNVCMEMQFGDKASVRKLSVEVEVRVLSERGNAARDNEPQGHQTRLTRLVVEIPYVIRLH
eukprot:scaffold142275_cov19-Prasinocladus_malaysianus.AAC.2